MSALVINSELRLKSCVRSLIDAYQQANTTTDITEYASAHKELCPSVKTYLKEKYGLDSYGVLDIEIDFANEIVEILEQRAVQKFGVADTLANDFSVWVTSLYDGNKSVKHDALLAAFEGDMARIDNAVEIYMASSVAK
jgi:hypothetical protein